MLSAKLFYWPLMLLLGVVLLSESAQAGDYGKIVGAVTDTKNHEPLIGAHVMLVGTAQGAVTDAHGKYVILNVSPGTYTIRISYVGYTTVEVKDIKIVQDFVTEINENLPEQSIELGQVIEIVAERPMIQKEVSASVASYSSQELRDRPIESIQSVISTSAGVVNYQGQNFIRGSRSTEVAYVVDGVPLASPISGSLMTDINKNAVEEMVLMTGGFSAEYGNAMGGVVNVTTKDGGSVLGGSVRYKTDKASSGLEYYQNNNIWDMTLGGPIYNDIRFFVTGYLSLHDMNPQPEVYAPDGTNLGRHPHEGYQEYRTNAKLTVPIAEGLKVRFTGSSNRTQQLLYNPWWRFGSSSDELDRYGATWQKTNYAAMIIDHSISPKTFYTLKLGYLDFHSKNGQRDRSEWSGNAVGANCNWWQDFNFREPVLDQNYHIPGDPHTYSKWRLRDSQGLDDVYAVRTTDAISANNPYGVAGIIQNTLDANYFQGFIYSGDRDYYEEDRNRQLSVRFDLTTQPGPDHEIKVGFEAAWHRVNRFAIGGMSTVNGIGVSYPVIDFYEESPSDTALSVTNASNLGNGYTPVELAGYGTYQLHFQGLFINLGLRYDYYNARTEFRVDPVQADEANPFKQTRESSVSKTQLSPRLGISFPVTDRIVFRFNYGQFFQRPPMERMFSYLWVNLNQADANMGNPNIEPQKTVSYEVGVSALLGEDFALGVTGFQKNMFNLEGYRMLIAPDLKSYFLAVNSEYGESYGVELSLRKRVSNWTSGFLNYTYSVARGTASDVTQISRYPIQGTTYAKELGYYPVYPEDTMPMNFDRTHTASLVFDFNVPYDEGPEVFGIKPLSGFGFDLTGTIQTGTPYSPQTSYFVNLTTDLFNSLNYPTTYSLDARFHKDFQWKGYELSIFAEVYNILNLDNATSVFAGSGNPDQPLYQLSLGAMSPDSYPSTSPLYSKQADTNGDGVLTPSERFAAYERLQKDMLGLRPNYGAPRRILLGIEARF